jgi:triosephosphate isomerase
MVEEVKRQYFVGGNWKCNGTQAFAKELIETTLNRVEYDQARVRKFIITTAL